MRNDNGYSEFFKEELYYGFVDHLIDKFGASKVIAITDDEPVITKKGVHHQLRKSFNEFLNDNPSIEKKFVRGGSKFMNLRNSYGGTLYFPVDPEDDDLMVDLKHRQKKISFDNNEVIPRPSKKVKETAEPMKGQLLKAIWYDKPYLCNHTLIIHFKRGYAQSIGKTTESMQVGSRGEAINILFNMYENKVAFAQIQGKENFEFVKRQGYGRKKKNQKLQDRVQQKSSIVY